MRSVFNQPEAVVLASKHLIDGSGQLRWVYRELAPTTPQDSGWFLFADNDSEQWNADPANFMPLVIDTATALAPSLKAILDLPYGTDLVFDARPGVQGWWDPKTKTPVWLADGSVTPNIQVVAGEVIESETR
ncbi:DUF2185 domain-containing protein [Leuconostoc holzapfelii]|uniref:DUF2185 domain-containing protein n=1 Tax=Leuconostoc holzapfelii TaxID=434464 RepID=A0A846ZFZ8_9LACO|nr:DUF2185 domain-containing protein [Leuconostoc holzapfelii]MCT8388709.1 DUF2185 domain-containing protein [Leuconostoc holzapfelii]NKZ19154.1 DUF2185 domain-containing protein [Leuconostoc holzapfelii]